LIILIVVKKLKKFSFALLFTFVITSCSNSDVIVQIYGAYEYNCTTDEYRILSKNIMLPFMKVKEWYTKEEFHEANVEYALEPYAGLAISDDGLLEITPSKEMSYGMLKELVMKVDCENPQDIMLF